MALKFNIVLPRYFNFNFYLLLNFQEFDETIDLLDDLTEEELNELNDTFDPEVCCFKSGLAPERAVGAVALPSGSVRPLSGSVRTLSGASGTFAPLFPTSTQPWNCLGPCSAPKHPQFTSYGFP